jgi:cytochrome c oxidase cbb3-type subunit 2
MPYLVKAPAPLVLVKDRNGMVNYHYLTENPVIPWLSEADAERLIGEGLVERIDDLADTAGVDDLEADEAARTNKCIAAMGRLDLPVDCSGPRAREVLREADHRFSNETIAAAVKARKASQPVRDNPREAAATL